MVMHRKGIASVALIVVAVALLTASLLPIAAAAATNELNGLSALDVLKAIGAPNSITGAGVSGAPTTWYYDSLAITFSNGVISSCEFVAPKSSLPSTAQKWAAPAIPSPSPAPGGGMPQPTPWRTAVTTYLGKLSANKYDPDSISNRYGKYGNPYGNSLTNPYSSYGSRYGNHSWANPYTTNAPSVFAADGTYLGKLSANRYDPDSISNPYGRYGSPYGNNLMNPYSSYGSPYSSQSWRNPYTTSAPGIYAAPSLPRLPALPTLPSLPTLPGF